MPSLWPALLWAVVIGVQPPPPPAVAPAKTGTAVIRGRVLAASTGDPIRKARVTASLDAGERDPVFTDAEGRFEFRELPAGGYSLSASKAGYTVARFAARHSLDRAAIVTVAAASIVDNVEIRMMKGAAISGRIVDDLGDPLVGFTVTAGRLVRTGGRPTLVPVGARGLSDDLGEYRIFGLSPGPYMVSVSSGPVVNSMPVTFATTGPAGSFTFVTRGDLPASTTWARTYYPGVTSLTQAQPITVAAGDEIDAIDFAVTATRAARLTMNVTDAKGNPASGFFTLSPDGPFEVFNHSGMFTAGSASTTIEPGDWLLRARAPEGVAMATLSVGSDDVAVSLVLTKGGTMSGRAVFEGPAPDNRLVLLEAIAQGAVDAFGFTNSLSGRVNPDGTFLMTDLLGLREFRLRTIPPGGWMLKSLTLNGRSLLDEPVEFTGGENLTNVQAVLTSRKCVLTGTVTAVVDGEKAAIADYSLVVFPTDRSRLRSPSRWSRWVRPDQTGRFTIDDLPAGNYLAIAVGEVDAAEWSNEAYLDRFRARATSLTLGEGEKKEVTLQFAGTP